MNIDEAIKLATSIDVENEALLSIYKDEQNCYYVTTIFYEDNNYVAIVTGGKLNLGGSGEGDVYSGETPEELMHEIAQFTDISKLQFHRLPISAGVVCVDSEISYVLYDMMPTIPNPEFIYDWSEYETIVDQHIENFLSQSA